MRIFASAVVAAAVGAGLLTACSGTSESGASTSGGTTTLVLWTHNAGNDKELGVVKKVIADFNASQDKYKVEYQAFPQGAYNDAVVAAASAKKLPCMLDVDGPNVPNWAWAEYLEPLDQPESTFADQLPSTVGKYDGKVYSFGFYDVAVSMISRKSTLADNGIRIPTADQPWTAAEFSTALTRLKASGKFAYPLDLATGLTGEWWSYGYSPLLQSFGGDLIDRTSYTGADGTLNGAPALTWAKWFQGLAADGLVAKKSGDDPAVDFINGKTAISWNGSWAADQVTAKFDDALFLPPPDFGRGPKIGGASWQWAISSSCAAKDGAQAYLKFSHQTKYFVEFAKTLGLIPATQEAAAQIPNFAPGGKYRVFLDLASKFAVVRPVTPAYPFISTVFTKAAQDILNGADPQKTLDKAVSDIDSNIKQNDNYRS
ncbi:extracellular solute-binding protein [Dactylosporangium sp. NPDC051541]|uniref:sugar ABC transporter substrate-binding protein n=1 Tax=Dactylosporangium sp. NPDC051541 TaxID=3363977 RepID=UPI0037A3B488